jgi:lipopolysaccharide/colanic/teichoic acid biosynthesis glycosyltransferase
LTEQLLESAVAQPSASAAGVLRRGPTRIGPYARVRRVIDLMLALFLLVLTSPLQALLALLIRLDSRGPAFFHQERVGQAGALFTIHKFRTMHITAPAYSYKVSIKDPRVTRLGKWLRRTGLDELPQLWNVVRGDMALIGPRPELPFIVNQYEDWQQERHLVRPGITGWWQVNHRNEVPMHLNIDYDIYYVRHMSPKFDIKILWHTMRVMLRGAAEAVTGRELPPPKTTDAG